VAMGQTVWNYGPVNPVCEPGLPGSWDNGGCWVSAVVFDGTTYHMWYTGLKQNWDNLDMGHATSPDGLPPWTKDPENPVLIHGASGTWDDQGVRGAAVIWDGALFHMWYGGSRSDGFTRALYATSPDGAVWTKHSGPVLDVGGSGTFDETLVRPHTVIVEGATYKMWYSGAQYLGAALGWSMRVGYAESPDGITWSRRLEPVLGPTELWEGMSASNPYILFDGTTYHMLYTGGTDNSSVIDLSIGYAYSINGINWTKYSGNPVVEVANGFVFSSPVIYDGTTWHMWHTHCDGSEFLVYYGMSEYHTGLFGDDFETADTSLWSVTAP
jgi:hypothetical protein